MYCIFAQDKYLRYGIFVAGVLLYLWPLKAIVQAQEIAAYAYMTIDVPGSSDTRVKGINDAGAVVGEYQSATGWQGFLFSNGQFSPVTVPGSSLTDAIEINNHGDIVGIFRDATGLHGFLFSNGQFSTFDVPGSLDTTPLDINDAGEVVGTYADANGKRFAFLFSNGQFSIFDVPESFVTNAHGINNAGEVVGYYQDATGRHSFLFSNGQLSPITVPGSSLTEAYSINDAGEVVGAYIDATGLHGFLFSNGQFSTVDVPGGARTQALGINNIGQISGTFGNTTGEHGFIATPIPISPPVIAITATPDTLWPPNGKRVPVTITGTITDEDSDVEETTATYAVTDEYGLIQPSGAITLDADGNYTFTIHLQASRKGNDKDGRLYTITISAFDNEGTEGSAATSVTVPHDQGQRRSLAAR